MYLTGTDGAAYNPYAYDLFGNILDPTTGKRRRTPGFKQNQGYTRVLSGRLNESSIFTLNETAKGIKQSIHSDCLVPYFQII